MNFKDKKILIGMITAGCLFFLLGLSFTKACADSKPTKQNNTSIEESLKEFLSFYYKERDTSTPELKTKEFLLSLDQESRLQIARNLIKESDGRAVYYGANILIHEGYMKEAIPALASLITSGRDKTDLKGRLGYEWVHNPDEFLAARIMNRICRYFIRNWQNYTDGERALAYNAMTAWLQLDPKGPFSADAAERALQKLESEAPESK
jgi:hypothetical protein